MGLDKVNIDFISNISDLTRDQNAYIAALIKTDQLTGKVDKSSDKLEKEYKDISRALLGIEQASKATARATGEMSQKMSKGLDKTKKKAKEVSGGFLNMGNVLNSLKGQIAAAFTVVALVRFGKFVNETILRMEAFQRRAKTVFGSATKEIESFAKANAISLGLTQSEFKGAAAAIGDIIVPMGLTRDRAAEMATELIKVAAAQREFNFDGRTTAEIARLFSGALTGEIESLKSLGIVIRQDETAFKSLVRLRRTELNLTLQQARATAIFELIISQSADAITSFNENQETLSRTQERTSARIRQSGERLSQELQPAVVAVTEGFSQQVEILTNKNIPAWARLATFLLPVSGLLKDVRIQLSEVDEILEAGTATIDGWAKVLEEVNEELGGPTGFFSNLDVDNLKTLEDYTLQLGKLQDAFKIADVDSDDFLIKKKTIEDLTAEIKELTKTDAERAKEAEAAAKKAAAAAEKIRKAQEAERKAVAKDAANVAKEEADQLADIDLDLQIMRTENRDEALEGLIASEEANAKKEQEIFEENEDKKNAIFFQGIKDRQFSAKEAIIFFADFSSEAFGLFGQLQANANEAQAIELQNRLEKGLITQEQFNTNQKRLRAQAAKDERKFALYESTINSISNVVKAYGAPGFGPPNIPAAVATGALGLLEIAAISSTPIPEFFKGVKRSPEGLAKVGEKGFEAAKEPGKGWTVFGSAGPEVRYLKMGTTIVPHEESKKLVSNAMLLNVIQASEAKKASNPAWQSSTTNNNYRSDKIRFPKSFNVGNAKQIGRETAKAIGQERYLSGRYSMK